MSARVSGNGTAREGLCQVCDRDYPVWFAPNPLWNRVMRDGVRAKGDMYAFICPTCFANIADEQNGEPLTWTMFEDGKFEEYQRVELHQAWTDKNALWESEESERHALREVIELCEDFGAPNWYAAQQEIRAVAQRGLRLSGAKEEAG